MFRAVKTLFLKEWRQIFPIWLTLLLGCMLMHIAITFLGQSQQNVSDTDTIVGLIIPMYGIVGFLYVAVAAAIIFCREHEETTYHFLKRLPIPPGAVCVSKIVLVVISSSVMLILLSIAANELIDLLNRQSDTDFWSRLADTNLIFTVPGYLFILFIAFTFGLFWSTQCKNQLNSVLLTIATVIGYCAVGFNFLSFFLAIGAVGIVNYSYDPQLQVMTAIGLSLASIPALGLLIVTLAIAWNWIDKKDSDQFRGDHYSSWEKPPIELRQPRSPFMALVWQTVRQSRLLLAFGLINGLIALVVVGGLFSGNSLTLFLNDKVFLYSYRMDEIVQLLKNGWFFIIYPLVLFYCGTVFWRDQTQNGYRFLTIHGVSGRQVWWSRMIVFGTVYFWWCVVMVALVVGSLAFTHWTNFSTNHDNNAIMIRDQMLTRSPSLSDYINNRLFVAMVQFGTYYLLLFAIGQLCSLFFRRWLISCFVMLFICGIATVWSIFIEQNLRISAWCILLPISFASLLATRLRTGDWLRDRASLRHYLKALSPIGVAFLLICITIPAIRIGAIPAVPRGICSPKLKQSDVVKGWRIVDANDQWLTDKTKELRLAQGDIGKMEEVWLEIQAGFSQGRFVSHCVPPANIDMFVYTLIDDQLTTLENEAVILGLPVILSAHNDYRNAARAFIESMPDKRVNPTLFLLGRIAAQNIDLANNRFPLHVASTDIKSPDKAWHYNAPQCEDMPFAYRLMFPWEKRRIAKALQYYNYVGWSQIESENIIQIPITSFYDRFYLEPMKHLLDRLEEGKKTEKEMRLKLLQRLA